MGWLDTLLGQSKADKISQSVSPVAPYSAGPRDFTAAEIHMAEAEPEYALEDEFRDYIRRDYLAGFGSDEEIVQNAKDMMADEMDLADLDRLAPALLAEVKAQQAEAQKTWPETTDCDRLDAAFAAMEASGIVARQNFSCCGTCGSTEIWDEMAEVRDNGGPVRSYTFYHMQDTESAVDGGGLYLGYGATEEGEGPALAVAKDIVSTLQAHGLQTHWNGSWSQRIGVSLDWQKRR